MTAIRKRRDVLLGTSRIALAAVLLAGSVKLYAADQASAPNTLTDAEKQAGWVLLFDGRTLGGWKASEDPVSFSVRDGMIVAHARGTPVKGQAGHPKCHLYYVGQDGRAEFTDFELRAEAKAERDSNGGIYFHTQFVPDNWPQKGMEVQINNLKTEKRKTGSLYAVADVADVLVPDAEWFQIDILVRGKRVTVALNGRTVVDWMQPENFQSPKNPT